MQDIVPYQSEEGSPSVVRKRPLLQWWALLPVLVFIVIQLVYGLPEARVKATGKDFVASFLLGKVIAGLLFSTLLAWIAYRFSRRSSLASSLVFTSVLAIFCLSAIAGSIRWAASSANSTVADVQRLPTFGVSLTGPAGWIPAAPDQGPILARWVSPPSPDSPTRSQIMTELRPPDADLDRSAQALAKFLGAKVVNDQETLDGTRAIRVRGESQGDSMPSEAIVSIHDGRMYLLLSITPAGKANSEALESVRQNWKWLPVEPPDTHLSLRKEPRVALGGQISLRVPEIARTGRGGDTNDQLVLAIFSYLRGHPAMTTTIKIGDLPDGDSLNDATPRLSAGLKLGGVITETLTWQAMEGAQPGLISQVVTTKKKRSEPTLWLVMALRQIDGKRFALITTTVQEEDANKRAAYFAASRSVIDSITPAKPATPSK